MSNLGDRMKAYEKACDTVMTQRLPVIIRIDGNSFSKWTKQMRLQKPVDDRMSIAMEEAMKAVFQYCSGAVFGYTQSDEITIILRNDLRFETSAMLANRTQKVVSLCASYATAAFNAYWHSEDSSRFRPACFDARVFVVPDKWEALNALVWRQQDAWRNCVSMFAYYKLAECDAVGGKGAARKLLHGKNINEQQELLFQLAGLNVNDIPTHIKRGSCLYSYGEGVTHDREMPILTEDPEFFLRLWKPREGEPNFVP